MTITNTRNLAAYLNAIDEDYHDADTPDPYTVALVVALEARPVGKAAIDESHDCPAQKREHVGAFEEVAVLRAAV